MKWLPGEKRDVERVITLADKWGYGNLISRLQEAWSDKQVSEESMPRHIADRSSGIVCVWCGTDSRTGQGTGGEICKLKAALRDLEIEKFRASLPKAITLGKTIKHSGFLGAKDTEIIHDFVDVTFYLSKHLSDWREKHKEVLEGFDL